MEVEGGRLIHQASGGGSGDLPEVGQEAAGVTGEQVTLQVKAANWKGFHWISFRRVNYNKKQVKCRGRVSSSSQVEENVSTESLVEDWVRG